MFNFTTNDHGKQLSVSKFAIKKDLKVEYKNFVLKTTFSLHTITNFTIMSWR